MRNLFSKKIGRTDFVNFITAALYIFIYRYIHTEFLVPVWGYLAIIIIHALYMKFL